MVLITPGSMELQDGKLDQDGQKADHAEPDRSNTTALQAERNDVESQRQWLEQTIEGEIIPRLMLAHRDNAPDQNSLETPSGKEPAADVVNKLSTMVLECSTADVVDYIKRCQSPSLDLETLCFDLLTLCARRLGEMWEQDLCDFSEVTIGLGRLHTILRIMSREKAADPLVTTKEKRILITPVPGEQHSFGSEMVGEFFRRAGWSVCSEPSTTKAELTAMVRREHFSILGLSIGAECWIESLAETIDEVRRASKNGDLAVMVGGPIFLDNPELAARVPAHAVCYNGRHALLKAEEIVQSASKAP